MKLPHSLLLASLIGGGISRADTISINFMDAVGADEMLPADIAGFDDPTTRVANWNNVQGAVSGTAEALVKQNGAVTTTAISWTTNLNTWRLPTTLDDTATGDDRMWKGYLDVAGGSSAAPGATITVTGIPFTGAYDVYVYFDGDNGANWRIANYEINSGAAIASGFGEDSENTSWGSAQNAAKVYQIPLPGAGGNAVWPISPNNSEGNTLRLGAKGSGFTLKAWGGTGVRAPINGFQIVESNDDDHDGLPNTWEIQYGLDPASAAGDNGPTGDPDGDELNNLGELGRGTSPILADTDNDGLSDLVETNSRVWKDATDTGTSPFLADTDADGMLDIVENPTQTTTGLSQPGTDPNKKDTDTDGVDDTTEVAFGTNPKLNTSKPALDPAKLDLLAYWPFNDSSVATESADVRHGIPGILLAGAIYTPDQGGRSGAAGDTALDLGNGANGRAMQVIPGGFLNMAASHDQVAVSFWQKLYTQSPSRAFYAPFVPAAGGDTRGISAHATWDNNTFYWDTAGCCDTATQRISAPNTADLTKWHHFVFQKNGPLKEIWMDGQLVVSGESTALLPDSFSQLFVGSGAAGAEQTRGVIDDFAVFGDALTQTQIGRLATGETPASVADSLDADGDGMPDAFETKYGLKINDPSDAALDPDGDTLTSLQEFTLSTDPTKFDTDSDGLSDKVESNKGSFTSAADTGTNPRNPDTDGDGLKDGVETRTNIFANAGNTGTDPFDTDTDDDSFSDNDEVLLGTNPVVITSFPPIPMAIGYWSFDDRGELLTNDASVGHHDGTVNGGPLYVAGHSGAAGDYAIDFDGSDDSVTTDTPLLSGLSDFTVAGWVKIPTPQLGDRKGLFGQNDVVEFGMITPLIIEFWTLGGGALQVPVADGILADWTHLTLMSSNGTRRIFLDGVVAGTTTITSGGASDFNFNIGGDGIQDGTGNYFLGQIDDVAIWDKALTDEQVAALAAGTLSPSAAVPAAAVATFPITAFSRTATTVTLTWASEAGASYTVQSSPSLQNWASAVPDPGATVTASGPSTTWTGNLPTPNTPTRLFYRVKKN
ncbi:MAG: LamG-like jellyroll fold domain-containing protein [Verrucomicrobiota bacterium]